MGVARAQEPPPPHPLADDFRAPNVVSYRYTRRHQRSGGPARMADGDGMDAAREAASKLQEQAAALREGETLRNTSD